MPTDTKLTECTCPLLVIFIALKTGPLRALAERRAADRLSPSVYTWYTHAPVCRKIVCTAGWLSAENSGIYMNILLFRRSGLIVHLSIHVTGPFVLLRFTLLSGAPFVPWPFRPIWLFCPVDLTSVIRLVPWSSISAVCSPFRRCHASLI